MSATTGLRVRWRALPGRLKLGLLIAALALVGLTWQHYAADTPPPPPPAAANPADAHDHGADGDDGHDHGAAAEDGHAHGEYQLPDSGGAPAAGGSAPAAVDLSVDAARATAQRFATNFASPGGDRDGWLARISPDLLPDLANQYRMTDIRNVPQAAVTAVAGPITQAAAGMTFEVSYSDNSRIVVGVDMADSGWKVASVVPAAADNPPLPAEPAGSR